MRSVNSYKHSLSLDAPTPIAYDKWIQEQIVDILGLPELYNQLLRLFEIRNFESHEFLTRQIF